RKARARIEQPEEDRHRDVVGQVRDDGHNGVRHDVLERHREDVAGDHLDAGLAGEARREPVRERGIDLDEVEPSGARGELAGQRAEAGADLQRDRARPELRRLDDPARDRGVAEEVLPPALPGAEAGGGERLARLPPCAHHPSQRVPNGRSASAFTSRPSSAPRARRGAPASAIIAALSVQNTGRGKRTSTPIAEAASLMRVRSRRFAATPPDTTRRSTPVVTSASTVVPTSMSTSASWRLAATSGSVAGDAGCSARYCRSAVLKPLKLKSKRLRLTVARGKRIAVGSPSRARRSITGPPG